MLVEEESNFMSGSDGVWEAVAEHLDLRSRMLVSCTCRRLYNLLKPENDSGITLETTDIWDYAGIPNLSQDMNFDGLHLGIVDMGFARNLKFLDRSRFEEKCFKRWRQIPNEKVTEPKAHGTECAFVLAGNLCKGAKFGHLKNGDARGGLMGSKVTLFTVSDNNHTTLSTAMEAAAASDLDFLSVSLSTNVKEGAKVFSDPISVQSFSAMLRGTFVCGACGNHGYNLMRNIAPWMTCLNACNSRIKMVTMLQLSDASDDNNHTFYGYSTNIDRTDWCELVFERDARAPRKRKRIVLEEEDEQNGKLKEEVVKDKIVIYDYVTNGKAAKEAKAAGVVIINNGEDPFILTSFATVAICVSQQDGERISEFIKTHKGAKAVIYRSEQIEDSSYPRLASFCSRIPNPWSKSIAKPDLFMTGMNILTATLNKAERRTKADNGQSFRIQSGTSMSTPAFCCLAGHMKILRPKWNSSMIRSAFMTTADPPNVEMETDYLATGSGVPNLEKASRPILVYNIREEEYCALIQSTDDCDNSLKELSLKFHVATERLDAWNLNYPSFRATFSEDHMGGEFVFSRTLMFIDEDEDAETFQFRAEFDYGCGGFTMRVEPQLLRFTGYGSEVPYRLFVTVNNWNVLNFLHGAIRWRSGTYEVRSPITLLREPGPTFPV